jgi:hypothetical protein
MRTPPHSRPWMQYAKEGYLAVALLAAASLSAGQGNPPATKPATVTITAKPVPDSVRFKVLAGYQKAMRLQSDYARAQVAACDAVPQCVAAREQLTSAIQAYNTAMPGWVEEAGLPKGFTLSVDDTKDAVTAQVPPTVSDKK